jgi:hypothetical protein
VSSIEVIGVTLLGYSLLMGAMWGTMIKVSATDRQETGEQEDD